MMGAPHPWPFPHRESGSFGAREVADGEHCGAAGSPLPALSHGERIVGGAF